MESKMHRRFQFQLWTTHNVMHVTSLIPFVCISFDSLPFLGVVFLFFFCFYFVRFINFFSGSGGVCVCVSSPALAAYSAYFFPLCSFSRSYSAHIISFYAVLFFRVRFCSLIRAHLKKKCCFHLSLRLLETLTFGSHFAAAATTATATTK